MSKDMKWKTEEEMNRRLLTVAFMEVSEQVMNTLGPKATKREVFEHMAKAHMRRQVYEKFLNYLKMFNPREANKATYDKVRPQLSWFPYGQSNGAVGNADDMRAAYLRLLRELDCKLLLMVEDVCYC